MLDFVLACARKEPHYRIYFWPSLGIALGRRFFDPTVMPCWLSYPRAICNYTDFSGSVKSPTIIIFAVFLSPMDAVQKPSGVPTVVLIFQLLGFPAPLRRSKVRLGTTYSIQNRFGSSVIQNFASILKTKAMLIPVPQ